MLLLNCALYWMGEIAGKAVAVSGETKGFSRETRSDIEREV